MNALEVVPLELTPDELLQLPRLERIRYVVKRFGPSQQKFADKAGLDRIVVNKLVRGKRSAGPWYAYCLAKVSGYDAELFCSPRSVAAAEREIESKYEAQVTALRNDVEALRADVRRLTLYLA